MAAGGKNEEAEPRRLPRSGTSAGLQPTKVGLYFGALALLVAVAALNTGNNGLFLVTALMLASVLGAHILGVANLRGLAFAASQHGEVFAGRPFHLGLRVGHAGQNAAAFPAGAAARGAWARRHPPAAADAGGVPRRGSGRARSRSCGSRRSPGGAAATACARWRSAASFRSAFSTRAGVSGLISSSWFSPRSTRAASIGRLCCRATAPSRCRGPARGTSCWVSGPTTAATTRAPSTGSRARARAS